jgi:hypothetical protein
MQPQSDHLEPQLGDFGAVVGDPKLAEGKHRLLRAVDAEVELPPLAAVAESVVSPPRRTQLDTCDAVVANPQHNILEVVTSIETVLDR